jgi:hypothetical protein
MVKVIFRKYRKYGYKIPGCSDYTITLEGDIYSWKSGKPYKMKPSLAGTGYYNIGLRNDEGEIFKQGVHRFVAMTYLPNPDNLPTVNHKDGNKQNNNVMNLEWASHSDQALHARSMGKGVKGKAVYQLDKEGNLIA